MKYSFLLPILFFMIFMRLYECSAGHQGSALSSEKCYYHSVYPVKICLQLGEGVSEGLRAECGVIDHEKFDT